MLNKQGNFVDRGSRRPQFERGLIYHQSFGYDALFSCLEESAPFGCQAFVGDYFRRQRSFDWLLNFNPLGPRSQLAVETTAKISRSHSINEQSAQSVVGKGYIAEACNEQRNRIELCALDEIVSKRVMIDLHNVMRD